MVSTGCSLCLKGAKMVLFVTGVCRLSCWYCPLSEERWQKDVVYANERPVGCDDDVLEEAKAMNALGTGITGGDPVVRLERTLHYAALLKNEWPDHHIHLYTASHVRDDTLKEMEGLIDEVRFHLTDFSDISVVRQALRYQFEVGVEIPMIPSRVKETRWLIQRLKGIGVHFVNINELEYADRTVEEMKKRKLTLSSDSCVVEESRKAVAQVVEDEIVHYCSARDKDSTQLRNRFIRRATMIRKPYEDIEDGLLVKGVIVCCSHEAALQVRTLLLERVDIPTTFVEVLGERVETHWALIEEAVPWVKPLTCTKHIGIEKRYPTYNQPLIEYIPL
ncbi:MAG: radical SAM protein [Theionarchaea archaeon]|nr:radical SAM protein [Theionarchaea archaeon]MBU7036636.1 radical SAM protein [Theionarchaea archaeon]